MKRKLISLLFLLPYLAMAQTFINLTPKPKQMTVRTGNLSLPATFVISTNNLTEGMVAEAQKFATALATATPINVTVEESNSEALFQVSKDATLSEESYKLDIRGGQVDIKASSPIGFYFAFQTVKKLLPPHVMAGVRDENVTAYSLPLLAINDGPRFSYRGFMLDVARHFFTADEVKRMIDVMSYYKMNRFHWHLSDDQGWRVEIKKYPKLTSIGSIAPNSRFTDMKEGQYWINRPYGPYFYTQEELKEVVAYAKERHIEIIPEIDMPGHFTAALSAYPEYSCNPSGNHTVWIDGGISSDVLNVANPAAVQFAKDILSEIMDIFPYEHIHIGGDECPTSAWQGNKECQDRYAALGLTNYRQLQSHFIKEIGDFVREKGRKLSVWNESITAEGADLDLIKSTDATVYCWMPADAGAKKAAELGMDNIFTPWGPYYINRVQSKDPGEPVNAGDGSDTVEKTYNTKPVPSNISSTLTKYYTGVQGTFWTEHVSDRNYMEYLALPRLIAVAETGWTPEASKNFTDFCKRITADSVMLNYNHYNYGRHYMKSASSSTTSQVKPKVSTNANSYYYRIVTRATDATRTGRCWELLRAGSPLLSSYSGNQAAVGKLWTNTQAGENDANYDYQLWRFEESTSKPGYYALCCKAIPNGSINPSPSAQSNSGRWNYDNTNKHYSFVLGEVAYGEENGNYYYSLRSENTNGWYMNASMGGQGLSVNLWTDAKDGNGGIWSLMPIGFTNETEGTTLEENIRNASLLTEKARTYSSEEDKQPGMFGESEITALRNAISNIAIENLTQQERDDKNTQLTELIEAAWRSLALLEAGRTYRIRNSVNGFEKTSLVDDGASTYLTHSTNDWVNDSWIATSPTTNQTTHTQSLRLRNCNTLRIIASPAASAVGKAAFPVNINRTGSTISVSFNLNTQDFTLSTSGKNLFPIPTNSGTLPGIISSGANAGTENAIRPVGAAWNIEEVCVKTYICTDESGSNLGTYQRGISKSESEDNTIRPEIKNFQIISESEQNDTIHLTYQRIAYTLCHTLRSDNGAIIQRDLITVPVGESYTFSAPEVPYYQFSSSDHVNGEVISPTEDMTFESFYTTDAYSGVRSLCDAVTKIEAGKSYVIYDNSGDNNGGRKGYRSILESNKQVNRIGSIEGATPYSTWQLEASGSRFKIKNGFLGLYVPSLSTSASVQVILTSSGDSFSFNKNADNSWCIKGSNHICWDGLENGNLVGWNAPGHPYIVYEYFEDPYFLVTERNITTDNTVLGSSQTFVKAGSSFQSPSKEYSGYLLKETQCEDGDINKVEKNFVVTNVFQEETTDGIRGIPSSDKKKNKEALYDLEGKKLKHISHPGIYIVNGMKRALKK